MNGQEFYEIFKNYKEVTLNRTGISVSFDSPQHAMEAFKELCSVLEKQRLEEKEMDPKVIE